MRAIQITETGGPDPTLAHYAATRDELLWRAGEVFTSILDTSLQITLSGRYPLTDAKGAHQDLQSRRSTGKLLLLPHGARG
jgi:NADPH:quinone reductase